MKIARCMVDGRPCWGLVDQERDRVQLIAGAFEDWAPSITAEPGQAPPLSGETLRLSDAHLLAPVPDHAMVVAVGATYAKHVADLGAHMPVKPGTFLKTRNTLIGSGAAIRYHSVTEQLDFECELVVVLGAALTRDDPMRSVLGYTVGNDISARDLQMDGGITGWDMFSGKALDGTGGVGPWIVTRDEIAEDHPDLKIETRVNGETRQSDRTGSMVWTISDLLKYVDARASFAAGDILFTGTCAGIGFADGRYLASGDVVEVTIEGIGTLSNTVGPHELADASGVPVAVGAQRG